MLPSPEHKPFLHFKDNPEQLWVMPIHPRGATYSSPTERVYFGFGCLEPSLGSLSYRTFRDLAKEYWSLKDKILYKTDNGVGTGGAYIKIVGGTRPYRLAVGSQWNGKEPQWSVDMTRATMEKMFHRFRPLRMKIWDWIKARLSTRGAIRTNR